MDSPSFPITVALGGRCLHAARQWGCRTLTLAAVLGIAGFAAQASAQGVPLGTAGSFGVLAGSEVTNTGPSVVFGSVGVWPGTSISGFPPGTIAPGSGSFHSADPVAQQAQFDLGVAYDDAAGRACDVTIPSGLLGGQTLTPGVYCMGSADLTGTLTLDGTGVYIFQIASALITAPGSSVAMINGAGSCDVFWQVTSSAAIDTTSQMAGTILALTSISLNTNASLSGRALARNALVSQSSNNITECTLGGLIATTLTTQASPAVLIGGQIHDTAFLSGGINPTGTITFNLFGPGDANCAGPSLFTSAIPVAGNGSYASANFTALVEGTYQWVASYSGDATNAAATTACNDPNESVIVSTTPLGGVSAIPALSDWGLVLLAAVVVLTGLLAVRRRFGH